MMKTRIWIQIKDLTSDMCIRYICVIRFSFHDDGDGSMLLLSSNVYSIISRYHFVLSLTIRSNTFGPTVFPIYRLGLIIKVGDLPKNIRMAKTILAQKYISTLLYFYCTFSFFWGVFHSHVDKGILHFMLMTADVRYCQVTQR